MELSHERQQEALKKAHAASPQVRRRAEFLQGDICDESNEKIVEAISTARVLFVTCFCTAFSVMLFLVVNFSMLFPDVSYTDLRSGFHTDDPWFLVGGLVAIWIIFP